MNATQTRAPQRPQAPQDCPRDLSVFINCPYDDDYRDSFEAIVFALLCFGLWPRWADDSSRSSTRLDRIARGLRASKYSIHDLSRCRGEGDENLARMNMPLELGMALEQAYPDSEPQRDHRCAVLVPEGSPYVQAVSDLKAFDLLEYDLKATGALRAVCAYINTSLQRVSPSTREVRKALPDWHKAMRGQRNDNDGCAPTWIQTVKRWEAMSRRPGPRY